MKAVIAYHKKLNSSTPISRGLKLNVEMEKRKKVIVRSFTLARNLYAARLDVPPSKEPKLEAGAEFLEVVVIIII